MNELKSEIIINAGIRAAERNFSSAYIIKRGDSDAGAIFVKIDTLGTVPVKDSLFGTSLSYKNMAFIPIEGVDDQKFEIAAKVIDKNGYKVPVFEVKVKKNVILFDQNKDLIKQENETIAVDGVNGPEIILGSLSNVSTNGNWPTIFDAKQ